MTWMMELRLRASPRLRVRANASRLVLPSRILYSDYDIAESFKLGADFAISPVATLTLAGERETIEHKSSFPPGTFSLIDERINNVTARLKLAVGRRLSLQFNATYEDRNANASLYDYESLRAGVRTVFEF